MINQSTKLLVGLALGLAAISTMQGIKVHRVMTEKAMAQHNVTESVNRWKQNYLALGESIKRWGKDYRTQESVPDLMTLISIIRLNDYGLTANTDRIILERINPVIQNGAPIGLAKVCLATSNNIGSLEIQAPSYRELFKGIKELTNRADIFVDSISIKGDKPNPVANLGDFCVLLTN